MSKELTELLRKAKDNGVFRKYASEDLNPENVVNMVRYCVFCSREFIKNHREEEIK